MKGTPETPQCGFSRASIQILGRQGVDPNKFSAFNVLEDDDLRQDLITFCVLHRQIMKTTSKPDATYRGKTSVPASVMFDQPTSRKLIKKARRQEQAGRHKFAIAKQASTAKETRRSKSRSQPEHPLARAFSGIERRSLLDRLLRLTNILDTVNHSQSYLHNQMDAKISAAYNDISKYLTHSISLYSLEEQGAVVVTRTLIRGLNGDEIKWDSIDGTKSGVTELGRIMRSYKKTIITAENELNAKHEELSRINTAIYRCAKGFLAHESLEPENLERIVTGASGALAWSDEEQQQLQEEVEIERSRILKLIEQENTIARNVLEDVEKKFLAKQREINRMEQSLFAIIRDDEY
ncbi:MAG: hypothetical protein Q9217_000911 [Psora testacea]